MLTPLPPNHLDLIIISWFDRGADIDQEPTHFSILSHECLAILVVCILGGSGTSF